MKLFNANLEMQAIVTMLKSKDKIARAKLFSHLNEDYFYDENTRAIFKRIKKLAIKQASFPLYEDLLHDPLLTQEQRDELKDYSSKARNSETKIKSLHNSLNEYRQARLLFFGAEQALKTLDEDRVDIEGLVKIMTDMVSKAKMSTISTDDMVTIGHKDTSDKLLQEVLDPKQQDFIPTGFDTWDSINGGMLPGSLFVVAANSGGGKSTLLNQLSINIALNGYKCRMIPLEMTRKEVMMRIVSNISNISLTKFVKGKLTAKEKKVISKKWKAFLKECKRLKGSYSIWDPEEDVSIDEALEIVRPYDDDVIVIDYIGLLKGVDGDNAWQALSNAARFAKIWAKNNHKIVVLAAQLSDEGAIRFSKGIKDHANNMWTWTFTDENRESGIIEVIQQKARNQDPFDFQLGIDFPTMRIYDLDKSQRNKRVKNRSEKDEKKVRRLKDASDDIDAYL